MSKLRDKYQNTGFNKILNKVRAETVLKYVQGKKCLEVGCGEGQITKYLARKFDKVKAVDIDETLLSYVGEPKNVELMCVDIRDVEPESRYDTIVCTNVLEHVDNPIELMEVMSLWGHKNSVYIFSTPNAHSINRIIGTDIGMLTHEEQLGKHDIDAGHKRIYNIKTLHEHVEKAGFKIITSGSTVYKPLPNNIMAKLPNSIIKKCLHMPVKNYGAEIYIIAKK